MWNTGAFHYMQEMVQGVRLAVDLASVKIWACWLKCKVLVVSGEISLWKNKTVCSVDTYSVSGLSWFSGLPVFSWSPLQRDKSSYHFLTIFRIYPCCFLSNPCNCPLRGIPMGRLLHFSKQSRYRLISDRDNFTESFWRSYSPVCLWCPEFLLPQPVLGIPKS